MDVHDADPAFGSRLIADALHEQGHQASENRVGRLCNRQRIFSAFAKKKGLRGKPGPAVHDDRVKRKFTADSANVLWLTDVTEHRTDEGKLYLCAIKDVWSNADRRILHRFEHESQARRPGASLGGRSTTAPGLRAALGPRVAVPIEEVCPRLDQQRPARVDGPRWRVRRQCRDGKLFRPVAEERPGSPAVAHQGPATPGDRDLD